MPPQRAPQKISDESVAKLQIVDEICRLLLLCTDTRPHWNRHHLATSWSVSATPRFIHWIEVLTDVRSSIRAGASLGGKWLGFYGVIRSVLSSDDCLTAAVGSMTPVSALCTRYQSLETRANWTALLPIREHHEGVSSTTNKFISSSAHGQC